MTGTEKLKQALIMTEAYDFGGGINLYADMNEVDDDVPREIEEIYNLDYVPEGYELVESRLNFAEVKYEYLDSNENYISFEQGLISNGPHGIDTDYTKLSII